MHFAIWIPDWDSLDSVRWMHSHLELAAIISFGFLALFDILAHIFEDERDRARLFERIGLWFFGIAIFTEIVGYVYGERNDTLSVAVISSLDAKAGDAATKAAKAVTDSGTALSHSNEAETKSGNAVDTANKADTAAGDAEKKVGVIASKADDLDTQLRTAETQLKSEQDQRAELEKSLRPRVFVLPKDDEKKLPNWDKIAQFTGTRIVLRCLPDPESERAASSIIGILGDAGWDKEPKVTLDPDLYTSFFDGVIITPWPGDARVLEVVPGEDLESRHTRVMKEVKTRSHSYRVAQELVEFLVENGWVARQGPTGRGDEEITPDSIGITIGFKPTPYFDPKEIKEMNRRLEDARRQLLNDLHRTERPRKERKLPPE